MDNAQAIGELLAATASMRRQIDRATEAGGPASGGTSASQRRKPEPAERPPVPLSSKPEDGRDFTSALELIQEASEALRSAERRAEDLEAELQEIATQASEAIRHLKERAQAAEARASEAEAMLARFHDAIFASFRPALDDKAGQPPAPSLRLIE